MSRVAEEAAGDGSARGGRSWWWRTRRWHPCRGMQGSARLCWCLSSSGVARVNQPSSFMTYVRPGRLVGGLARAAAHVDFWRPGRAEGLCAFSRCYPSRVYEAAHPPGRPGAPVCAADCGENGPPSVVGRGTEKGTWADRAGWDGAVGCTSSRPRRWRSSRWWPRRRCCGRRRGCSTGFPPEAVVRITPCGARG